MLINYFDFSPQGLLRSKDIHLQFLIHLFGSLTTVVFKQFVSIFDLSYLLKSFTFGFFLDIMAKRYNVLTLLLMPLILMNLKFSLEENVSNLFQ